MVAPYFSTTRRASFASGDHGRTLVALRSLLATVDSPYFQATMVAPYFSATMVAPYFSATRRALLLGDQGRATTSGDRGPNRVRRTERVLALEPKWIRNLFLYYVTFSLRAGKLYKSLKHKPAQRQAGE